MLPANVLHGTYIRPSFRDMKGALLLSCTAMTTVRGVTTVSRTILGTTFRDPLGECRPVP